MGILAGSLKSLLFFLMPLMIIPAPSSNAQNVKKTKGIFGICYGTLSSGDIKFDGKKVAEKAGAGSGGIFLDIPVGRKLFAGVYGDIHQLKGFTLENKPVLDVGLTFTAAFRLPKTPICLKPGIGIGFAMVQALYTTDESRYLTCRGFLDFVLQGRSRVGLLAQIGLMRAPLGGNADYDITIGPMFFARAGLVF